MRTSNKGCTVSVFFFNRRTKPSQDWLEQVFVISHKLDILRSSVRLGWCGVEQYYGNALGILFLHLLARFRGFAGNCDKFSLSIYIYFFSFFFFLYVVVGELAVKEVEYSKTTKKLLLCLQTSLTRSGWSSNKYYSSLRISISNLTVLVVVSMFWPPWRHV